VCNLFVSITGMPIVIRSLSIVIIAVDIMIFGIVIGMYFRYVSLMLDF
jgi:hypothetical protein